MNFSGLSIFLNENIQYAIVVTNDDPTPYNDTSTQWQASSSDLYAGGAAWAWDDEHGWMTEYIPEGETIPLETYYNKDLAFQTFMVPESITLALLGFGAFALRKRK